MLEKTLDKTERKSKYAYGYKFNEERMNKQSILLPVDEEVQPDWAFMEEYTRERESGLLEQYKQFILRKYVLPTAQIALPLEQAEWKEFVIGELFDIKIGQAIDGNKVDLSSGKVAYITRKESNNGLDGFIDNDTKFLNSSYPVITIGNETAEPFVQVFPFYTGTKVNILVSKTSVSARTLLFVVQSLKMHKAKYSYSFTINSTRLRKQVIMLPSTNDGEPDWEYMEQYIRTQENMLLAEYKERVLTAKDSKDLLTLCSQFVNVEREREREREREATGENWKEFELSRIFTIRSTASSIDKINLTGGKGKYPYITRSDTNNGINDWIAEQSVYATDNGNCITVGLDTQTAFYQTTPFYTGQNIQIFTSDNLNADNAQFILPLLKNAMSVFSWGSNGATLTRLRRSKIMLPAASDGEPDWGYMTQYGRAIQIRQAFTYLDYLEKRV